MAFSIRAAASRKWVGRTPKNEEKEGREDEIQLDDSWGKERTKGANEKVGGHIGGRTRAYIREEVCFGDSGVAWRQMCPLDHGHHCFLHPGVPIDEPLPPLSHPLRSRPARPITFGPPGPVAQNGVPSVQLFTSSMLTGPLRPSPSICRPHLLSSRLLPSRLSPSPLPPLLLPPRRLSYHITRKNIVPVHVHHPTSFIIRPLVMDAFLTYSSGASFLVLPIRLLYHLSDVWLVTVRIRPPGTA